MSLCKRPGTLLPKECAGTFPSTLSLLLLLVVRALPSMSMALLGLRGTNSLILVYSGLMDLAFVSVSWKIITPLHLGRKEKIGALAAMSMGAL